MDKIAISFGNISIYWYSIMILIGVCIAYLIANFEVKKQKINKDFFTNLVFYVVLFGILGARIYYVIFNFDYYLSEPSEIIKIWHGGLAIHGGIIAGTVVTFFYCKKHNVNMLKMLDIMVVGFIIAQAIGRWGNFFNQEAFGNIVTEQALIKMHLPRFIINGMYIDGAYRQPTFLFESIWNLIGFIILIIKRRRVNTRIGEITGLYLIWYSFGRFIIEHYRSDSLMLGPLKAAQIISILLIVLGIVIIIKSKKKTDNLYNKAQK